MKYWSTFKTLILYQLTTIAFRAIVAYISITCGSATQWITLFALTCVLKNTVKNVGPPHLGFPFPVGPPPSSLCNRRFRSYQNPRNIKSCCSCSFPVEFPSAIGVDNVSFQGYQNPVNSESWHSCRLYLSELPKCQQL